MNAGTSLVSPSSSDLHVTTAQFDAEQAVLTWFEDNTTWLTNRCCRRLGNNFDAQDAMQEIVMKVLHSVDKFEGRSSFKTWVVRIADNHCYTQLKREKATTLTDHLNYSISLLEQLRLEEGRAEMDEKHEIQVEVQAVLARLEAKNRDVLQLRFFKDLSLEAMADTLGLSLSATKMRLYRAMDSFKQQYRGSAN